MRLARLIEPGEQVLAGQIVAVAHETDQRAVGDRELPHLARFGLVFELEHAPVDIGVALAERGRAVALVSGDIAFAADAHEAETEQQHHRSDGARFVHPAMAEILRAALSQPGAGGADLGAQYVFLGLARLAEIRVIAILFAALLAPADRP